MFYKRLEIGFAYCIALLGATVMLGCVERTDTTSLPSPTFSNGNTVDTASTAEVAADASAPELSSSVPAKVKREPIYIEESNGQELITAALRVAQQDHKHVLVEWGGNWCGWCYKLHDVFHKDPLVQPIIQEEFVLVLVDSGPNKDLMLEYGGKDRQYSYPHLTVLDEHGSVLTNQETGSLEEGPKHDPKLVAAFLSKWMPQKIDAEKFEADLNAYHADRESPVGSR